MKKITASTIEEIIETDIVNLSPGMDIEDAATLMLEKGKYYCPVLEDEKLVGIFTKKDIVRSIAKS